MKFRPISLTNACIYTFLIQYFAFTWLKKISRTLDILPRLLKILGDSWKFLEILVFYSKRISQMTQDQSYL